MGSPVVFVRKYPEWSSLTLWCPGCRCGHTITVGGPEGWTWDGDRELPTISPSILSWPRKTFIDKTLEGELLTDPGNVREVPRCHSFVRDGRWEFLGDSGHELAGQTVAVQPFPDTWNLGDG